MALGIECLLCEDEHQALKMASTLDELNRERREIQKEMQELADVEMLVINNSNDMPLGLCLYSEEWHQGVVGILASKLKDKWHRPAIVFAKDSDGLIKGSARSITHVHIRDVIDCISTREPDLVVKFGGHAMAAGLTIQEDNFIRFKTEFEEEMLRHMTKDDLESALITDGDLAVNEINLSLAEAISRAGPWGQGFPEPVFDGVFEIADRRIVGENHLKMSLKFPDSNNGYDAIAFYTHDENWPAQVDYVQLAYRLDINDYKGRRSVQLVAEYVEPVI
ncbi:MAG: DHHA1 domain-containing protein, partial [Gammaproteobacteria bacterium]